MGRHCKICTHPDRAEIDAQIIKGVPNTHIAARFGLTEGNVRRHKAAGHVKEAVRVAHEHQAALVADDLFDIAQYGLTSLLDVLKRSRDTKNDRVTVQAVRELREYVKFLNDDVFGPIERTASVRDNPAWVDMRSRLMMALEEHPAARVRIIEVLGNGECDG